MSNMQYSFGFTDAEVDSLFERYLKNDITPKMVTRDELRDWYDGYIHVPASDYIIRDPLCYHFRIITLEITGPVKKNIELRVRSSVD